MGPYPERLRAGGVLAATAAIATLDLWTKAVAADRLSQGNAHALLPGLDLRLAFNHGISFSLLPAHDPAALSVLLAFQGTVTGLVAWLAFRAAWPAERLGLALIAGGALGNLLDRWRNGSVTDWIDLHPAGTHWFTFNLADAFITLGVVLMTWDALFGSRRSAGSRSGA
jgi:signal peptidase II